LIQYEKKIFSMVKILLILNKCDGETLANLTKQNTQQRGEEEQKEKDISLSEKHKNPKWVTKRQRNKLCSKAPTNCKKHIKKERETKLERIVSLEEPSPTMTTCFKIESVCILCKAIDIFCLWKAHRSVRGRPPMPFVGHAILTH
jgi:hypothetical protein